MKKSIQEATVLIIGGFGKVGQEVKKRLKTMGCEHILIGARHDHTPIWEKGIKIDLVFLAIPTEDDGSAALQYIKQALEYNIPIITCEKGALANHFEALRPHLDNIGYSATVGGGSGLIDALRTRLPNNVQEIHVILNGTLNDVWGRLAAGYTLEEAVREAKVLGYAEPGEKDPVQIIKTEVVSDAIKKTLILFNLCLNTGAMLREAFNGPGLSEERIRFFAEKAKRYRFIVSFYRIKKNDCSPYGECIFSKAAGDYIVVGAFREQDHPLIARLCEAAPGVSNGFLTREGEDGKDGTCLHVGPGAGPGPTAAAMIRDAERLLAK